METGRTTPLYDDDYYNELYTFLQKYDDYDLPEFEIETITDPGMDRAVQAMLTISIILGCFSIIILLTALSEKARSVPASWYVYSLALETVIQSLVFIPSSHSESYELNVYGICRLEDTRRSFGLVRVVHIILINVEVCFTIMVPLKLWQNTALRRFLVMFGSTWILAFVFSDMILPSLQDTHCFHGNHAAEVTIHVVLNWLPGLIVLGLNVAIVIFYSKGCFLRHEHSQHPGLQLQRRMRARAHEWFIFIMILNGQFLILDLVLIQVIHQVIATDDLRNIRSLLYLTIVHELLRFVPPLTLVAIAQVRGVFLEALRKVLSMTGVCKEQGVSQDEEALTMSGTAEQCV